MRILNSTARNMLVSSCLFLLLPMAAQAAPGSSEMPPERDQAMPMAQHQPDSHEKGRGLDHGGLPEPEFMHGLDLSEAQRDSVFEIMHDQMPFTRQKHKAIRSAQNELRRLALSNQYEEAKARALAEKMTKDMLELTLLQARTSQMLYALLDPAQRRQITAMPMRMGFDGMPTPGPGFPSMPDRPAPR